MRDFIRKKLHEGLVTEKLTNVDDDVNLIYDTYFKDDIDEIQKTGIAKKNMFQIAETDTSILKTSESIEADNLNRCTILINRYSTNHYNPKRKRINLAINKQALEVLMDSDGSIEKTLEWLPDDQKKSFKKEFTEEKIKSSIHHELAHWIDDTMHNKHIEKKIDKANEFGKHDPTGSSVLTSKFEIQGQIHNIKQLHNKYKDNWDQITFKEMIEMLPSLIKIYKKLDYDLRKQWTKDIKVRMHREGLLGKNMVNT